MREDQAQALWDAIADDDAAAVAALLSAEPRLTGTPTPVARGWGEEMWLGLHHASAVGHVEPARLLLEAGASVDARTRFRTPMHGRETALVIASRAGHAPAAALLLAHHADPGLLDATHRSALGHAAEHGHTAVIRSLIDAGAVIDAVDDQQRTPLHWAIRGGHADAALVLIDAGADVNHPCPKEPPGFTPLHRCVSAGESMRVVADRLLEAGADRAPADPRDGRTPCDLANALGHDWPGLSVSHAD